MQIYGFQKTTLLDYPGRVACTIFTGGCNFRCPFCQNSDLIPLPPKLPVISEEEVFSHLKKRRTILDGICITGGEPTLSPDLFDFIHRVRSLGLSVKLDTNGYRPDVLEALVSEGLVNYVAMDIKQAPEKYNFISRLQDFDLSRILASAEFLMNGSVPYEFRTTVVKELHDQEDLLRIGSWLKGASAYFLQPYRGSRQVLLPVFSSYTSGELLNMAAGLRTYIPNTSIRGMDSAANGISL